MVNLSLSDIFIFPNKRKITPIKATIPRIMQKGINLGYCILLSNEIPTEMLNKSKRQVSPKLKKVAFPNVKAGRMIKIDFFIPKSPFYALGMGGSF